MSIQAALNWTIYLLGLSLWVQAFEMRFITQSCSPWSWTLLRADFVKAPKIMTDFFDLLFTKYFLKLIHTQIVLVLILVVFPDSVAYLPAVISLIVCCFLISLRFRGLFNGGSDSMTMVVLLGLLIPAIQPGKESLIKIGLYYISFQSTLSYFVSGIIKLKNKSWRTGFALQFILKNPNYIVPESIRLISAHLS